MSVFNPDISVPDDLFGATAALHKQCKSLKGTAGWKSARITQEITASKKKHTSQLHFLRCPETIADAAASDARITSSESDEPAQV